MSADNHHRRTHHLQLSIPQHSPSSIQYPPFTPTPSKRRASSTAASSPAVAVALRFLSLNSLFLFTHAGATAPPFAAALLSSVLLLLFPSPSPPPAPALPPDLKPLLLRSLFLSTSLSLRFLGLRHVSAGGAILAEFSATLVSYSAVRLRTRSGIAGAAAAAVVLLLLALGYDRVSCADCDRPGLAILIPITAGVFSVLEKSVVPLALVRSVGRLRLRGYVLAIATAILAIPAFGVAILQGEGLGFVFGLSESRMWLALVNVAAFGIILGDSTSSEKIAFAGTALRREFMVMFSCTLVLQLLYVPKFYFPGFLLCGLLLWLAVVLLGPSPSSYIELGDFDGSESLYAAIVGALRHILGERKSRKIALFLLINTAYMVVELVAGFMSNSLGLISDSCHMLFDCAALAIGLYASYISRLPANGKYNYGRGRFEVVSGYVNAVLLVLVGVLIVLESIERILDPREISTGSLLVVSIGGLVVNVIGLIFFHEEHHHAHGGGSCSHSHSSSHSHPHSSSCSHSHSNSHSHSHSVANSHFDSNLHHHDHDHDHHRIHAHGSVKCSRSHSNSHSQSQVHDHGHSHLHLHDQDHHHAHEDMCSQFHSDNRSRLLVNDHVHSHLHHRDDNHQHNCGHEASCNRVEGCLDNHMLAVSEGCIDGHLHKNDDNHHRLQDHLHVWNEKMNAPELFNGETRNITKHGHDHDHDCNDCEHGRGNKGECFGAEKLLACSQNHNDEHHKDSICCDSKDHSHSSVKSLDSAESKPEKNHHIDHNMEGIFLHVLADTMGSVGVVASTLVIKYKGWLVADPICSVFISVMIVASVLPLLRNSAEILLQRAPRSVDNDVKVAVDDVRRIKGVCGVEDVHLWNLNHTDTVGTVYLSVVEDADKACILERASRVLKEAGVKDLTIQVTCVQR